MAVSTRSSFQLKTSFLPCTILQLNRYDLSVLENEIRKTISQAPMFFAGAPVVIDLEKVQDLEGIDFLEMKRLLISNGLVPIGVRGGSETQTKAAGNAALPLLNLSKTTTVVENKKPVEEPEAQVSSTTRFINTPIRSGMQIYAKDGDLIVAAQVSPGAELMADGNIHIYGALRGRAMAGVKGNTEARIFCQTLDAELVSIAGYYLTKEEIQKLPEQNSMIQIYLENDQVTIKPI